MLIHSGCIVKCIPNPLSISWFSRLRIYLRETKMSAQGCSLISVVAPSIVEHVPILLSTPWFSRRLRVHLRNNRKVPGNTIGLQCTQTNPAKSFTQLQRRCENTVVRRCIVYIGQANTLSTSETKHTIHTSLRWEI